MQNLYLLLILDNQREIKEEIILQNKYNFENIISKFIGKLWGNKELEGKFQLKYYKEVIDTNLENKKHISILTIVKNKINIVKIRNTLGGRICHLCNSNRAEAKKSIFLDCLSYILILRFHLIWKKNHTTNLLDLLSHKNCDDLGMLCSLLFEDIHRMLK